MHWPGTKDSLGEVSKMRKFRNKVMNVASEGKQVNSRNTEYFV